MAFVTHRFEVNPGYEETCEERRRDHAYVLVAVPRALGMLGLPDARGMAEVGHSPYAPLTFRHTPDGRPGAWDEVA